MGRLLKKKSPIKKKKKSDSDLAGTADTGQNDLQFKSGTADDSSKKQTIVPKKIVIPAKPAVPVTGEKNVIQKSIQFLKEVKAELKKVVWPSRKQAMGSTVVVIILVIIISFFLGFVDIGLSSLVRVVLQN